MVLACYRKEGEEWFEGHARVNWNLWVVDADVDFFGLERKQSIRWDLQVLFLEPVRDFLEVVVHSLAHSGDIVNGGENRTVYYAYEKLYVEWMSEEAALI